MGSRRCPDESTYAKARSGSFARSRSVRRATEQTLAPPADDISDAEPDRFGCPDVLRHHRVGLTGLGPAPLDPPSGSGPSLSVRVGRRLVSISVYSRRWPCGGRAAVGAPLRPVHPLVPRGVPDGVVRRLPDQARADVAGHAVRRADREPLLPSVVVNFCLDSVRSGLSHASKLHRSLRCDRNIEIAHRRVDCPDPASSPPDSGAPSIPAQRA
jgi:hypothetical protein